MDRLRPGSPKPVVLAFTAALLVVVAGLMLADLQWRRRQALDSAEARAQNRADITAEYVRGRFALVDAALRQLVIHGERVGGSQAGVDEWTSILQAARASLPGNGSVSVTDARGIIRYSTLSSIVGQPRGDDYVFRYLSTHDVDEMVIGSPFHSPKNQRILIPVGRRLTDGEGAFDGLVVAVVAPEDFGSFFRTVSFGSLGIAWAFHPTGLVLVREPRSQDVPTVLNTILEAAQRGSGPIHGPVDPGGPSFVTAMRSLDVPRLTVAVSLSEAEVLADWRAQQRTSTIAFIGLALTLGIFVVLLFRQMDALAAAVVRERDARNEAEHASRLKDEFLMTLSHELRTPLNAIVGWIRMLTTGTLPPDSHSKALSSIERNAQIQTSLVEELLDVSRAITGKLKIEARPMNLAEAVLAAVETLRPALIARRIHFEADVDQTLPPITADPERLQQVVWNLLSNAIKFTPPEGRITLSVGREGTHAAITVRDNGIGISPEFLPFVFDRFRQADAGPRREQGGLGLGLAIVRHLVELHGGTVTARSSGAGTGATFQVLLPLN
jgi:signal transduction histidine kinase